VGLFSQFYLNNNEILFSDYFFLFAWVIQTSITLQSFGGCGGWFSWDAAEFTGSPWTLYNTYF
jgi:hypothetical protein